MDRFYESQSPQTGQFNSYYLTIDPNWFIKCSDESQSPQTGQFNSYLYVIVINWKADCKQAIDLLQSGHNL